METLKPYLEPPLKEMGDNFSKKGTHQGVMIGLVIGEGCRKQFDISKLSGLPMVQSQLGARNNIVLPKRDAHGVSLKDEMELVQKLYKAKHNIFMTFLYRLSYPANMTQFFDHYLLIFQNQIVAIIEPEDYLKECSFGC